MTDPAFDWCTSVYRLGETTRGWPHLCVTWADGLHHEQWASFVHLGWVLAAFGIECTNAAGRQPTLNPHLCRSFNESCPPWLFDWNCSLGESPL